MRAGSGKRKPTGGGRATGDEIAPMNVLFLNFHILFHASIRKVAIKARAFLSSTQYLCKTHISQSLSQKTLNYGSDGKLAHLLAALRFNLT